MARKTIKTKTTIIDLFKQALKDLNLKPENIFAHREYQDRIVLVSKDGRKYIWRNN